MATQSNKPAGKRDGQNGGQDRRALDRGRPPKYDPKFCRVAKRLFEIGGTDADLARALGISRSTVLRWKAERPAFLRHCKLGVAAADQPVEVWRRNGTTFSDSDVPQ